MRPWGAAGPAWPYPTILAVVAALTARGHAILGGDVWREVGGQEEWEGGPDLTLTYGDWFSTRPDPWAWSRYVVESGRTALDVVERYQRSSGDGIWYEPVFVTAQPAIRHTRGGPRRSL